MELSFLLRDYPGIALVTNQKHYEMFPAVIYAMEKLSHSLLTRNIYFGHNPNLGYPLGFDPTKLLIMWSPPGAY